jgi:hypothetical protein
MNCDNRYAKCCGCPAITNAPREFTIWSSSKLYNLQTMKKTGLTNAHDYRASLQANTDSIMKNTVNDFDTNFKCKSNGSNLFYLDSSSYNNYYDSINVVSKKPEVENYQKNAGKGVLLDSMASNMALNSISLSSIVSKNNKYN